MGEIPVFLKDGFGRHILRKLDQETFLADKAMQGVKGFHASQIIALDVGLAQWGHPQVNESMSQGGSAEAAIIIRHDSSSYGFG